MVNVKVAGTCDDDVVQFYVDQVLSREEAILFEVHLARCATCRRAVAEYKALFWDLGHAAGAATDIPVPEELQSVSDALMARWEEAQAEARPATLAGIRLPVPGTVPVLVGTRARYRGWVLCRE